MTLSKVASVSPLSIFLIALRVSEMGLSGIAVAYSLASLTGGLNILILFKLKAKKLSVKPLFITLIKSLIACSVMAIAVIFVKSIGFGEGKINLILKLMASGVCGVIVYALSLIVLRTKEITNFLKRGN